MSDPYRSSPGVFWTQFIILGILVLLAAFFAASEAALISVSRLRARTMADRRVKGSQAVLTLVDDKNRYLTSILVGNTIVLLASDSLATYVAIEMGLPAAALISTVFMTVVMLLFGEIVPKMVATADNERWALRLSTPMRVAAYILTPIAQCFQIHNRTDAAPVSN